MNHTPGKAERKYLAAHAEPEAQLCEAFDGSPGPYGHVLVIPASGEGHELWQTLASLPEGPLGPVLTILVINATPDAPASVHETNAQTLEDFARRETATRTLGPNASLYTHAQGSLLVLDRATRENQFPSGQGVGLARKIGGDLALALVLSGRVAAPWIHVTDADVVFPPDYFHQVAESDDAQTGAFLYRFRHRPGNDSRSYEAALQYELSLRYYVTGLRFAGSKYAFHSIGSTLALQPGAYARVRGFPRRMAAEDFYLLNKIAKVGRVASLSGAPLGLSSRVSHRVPFGTGAAIARLLEDPEPQRSTYHPALFHHLRAWLEALEEAIASSASTRDAAGSLADRVRERAAANSAVDPGALMEALKQTGALSSANEALAAPARTIRRRVNDTFDGFRTLKLLHSLRDSSLPDLPLRDALEAATFLPFREGAKSAPLEEIIARIEGLEGDPPIDESRSTPQA